MAVCRKGVSNGTANSLQRLDPWRYKKLLIWRKKKGTDVAAGGIPGGSDGGMYPRGGGFKGPSPDSSDLKPGEGGTNFRHNPSRRGDPGGRKVRCLWSGKLSEKTV